MMHSLIAMLLLGCAPKAHTSDLRDRAAYDMKCSDKTDIAIKPLGNDSYDVTGCGKRATYQWTCNGSGPMASCRWHRTSESSPRSGESH